jgi:hypothetical protein
VDNPTLILTTVDRHLDHEVKMILYGRAALTLGYTNTPQEAALSMDVDAILPLAELAGWESDTSFWTAQERANAELEPQGLYFTHLFAEDQVVLRPDWLDHLVSLLRPKLRWLRLFRPATLDLVLTKMMRGADEQDLSDAQFLIRHDQITRSELEGAIMNARLPDVPEIREAFERARPRVLAMSD